MMIASKDRIYQEYLKHSKYLSHADAIRKTAEQLFMLESEVQSIVIGREVFSEMQDY
jgi:hypothetical protein